VSEGLSVSSPQALREAWHRSETVYGIFCALPSALSARMVASVGWDYVGLDLQHGGPSVADQKIVGGGYEHIAESDFICITAGLRRKPDESRLDLINRNTDLFMQILGDVKAARPKPSAIVVVVSNPVDILTFVAAKKLGLPERQVVGLGTQLDTIRFRSLIAAQLDAPKGVFGVLVAALRRRRERRMAPFTVMSCDNIPGNGHVTQNAVVGLARLIYPELAGWVDELRGYWASKFDALEAELLEV
jgi:hypothetical protein